VADTHTDRELVGRVRALTTLSPIRTDRRRKLRRRLSIVRYTPGLGRPLHCLSFIHYAHWCMVSSLPTEDGSGRKKPLNWRYLLFHSNYDGSEQDYLDTFADVLPLRLSAIFGSCVGFAENVEEAGRAEGRVIASGAFRAFVKRNKLETLAFYAADPDATVTRIRRALGMDRRERRANRIPLGGSVLRVEDELDTMALGPPRESKSDALLQPWARALWGRYGVNQFLAATPLKPGAIDSLREACAEIRPLQSVPRAHFARLAIIPPTLMDLGQRDPDRLKVPYVLFASNYDGRLDDHLEAIRDELGDAADRIWGHCAEYPPTADRYAFRRWLKLHELRPGSHLTRPVYYVAGYAPKKVDRIDDLVAASSRRAEACRQRRTPGGKVAQFTGA
jgi:hypothetical protein